MENTSDNKSTVAIIGSRGIPNFYGGFEAFAENLSIELVKRNIPVYVSCENLNGKTHIQEYEGVEIFYFPLKPPGNAFLRMVYEFLYDGYSLIWASRRSDNIYMLGYSAAIFFFIPKIFGKKLFVNPGGLEWKRDKFNTLVKSLLKFSERLMTSWASVIITDSHQMKRYLDSSYNTDCIYIPYGVQEPADTEWEEKKLPTIIKKGLSPDNYWLVVARLEPENNIHTILKAYQQSRSRKPLLIVGNYSSPSYKKKIEDTLEKTPADKKILLIGGVYDKKLLDMLRQNCFVYLHGHSVGGTNPSLLESMIMKNMILAHDNPFNREVSADSAIYFKDSKELTDKMEMIENNNPSIFKMKEIAYNEVRNRYSWDRVFESYESLFDKERNE